MRSTGLLAVLGTFAGFVLLELFSSTPAGSPVCASGAWSAPRIESGSTNVAQRPHAIGQDERSALKAGLEKAPEAPLRVETPTNSPAQPPPLSITQARFKAVHRDLSRQGAGGGLSGAATNDYAISTTLALHNQTDGRIQRFVVKFTNEQAKISFFVCPKFPVEAQADLSYEIPFMLVSGDPADLRVEVIGAVSQGGGVWGLLPKPGSNLGLGGWRKAVRPDGGLASGDRSAAYDAAGPKPDQLPKALNRPRPNYTEEATINFVDGGCNLKVLVNKEGGVDKVEVLSSLPDGLTEQAIRAANDMRFTPAQKAGEPVACWVYVEVDFFLG
ncbi:MAG TPA: energy transducer TonB [Blastocatellia bacterium]